MQVKQLALGFLHSCAYVEALGGTGDLDDVLFCWGYNGDGQVGVGTQVKVLVGVVRDGIANVRAPAVVKASKGMHLKLLALGGYSGCGRHSRTNGHTCGVWTHSGSETLFCWGTNVYGQLGIGKKAQLFSDSTYGEPTPKAVTLYTDATATATQQCDITGLSLGSAFSCMMGSCMTGGNPSEVKCWGASWGNPNEAGALGFEVDKMQPSSIIESHFLLAPSQCVSYSAGVCW